MMSAGPVMRLPGRKGGARELGGVVCFAVGEKQRACIGGRRGIFERVFRFLRRCAAANGFDLQRLHNHRSVEGETELLAVGLVERLTHGRFVRERDGNGGVRAIVAQVSACENGDGGIAYALLRNLAANRLFK